MSLVWAPALGCACRPAVWSQVTRQATTPRHLDANSIPCVVGQMVTQVALNAGAVSNTAATVDGEWMGYQGSYDLGSFACTPNGAYPWHVTCVHAPSAAPAQVTVSFSAISNVD